MNKKLAIAAAAALAVGLAGCGTGGQSDVSTSGGATVGAATSVELKVWSIELSDNEKAAMDELVSEFTTANPGVTITIEQRATDPHKEALRLALGTPSFPDIYWYWEGPGLGGELVGQGASLDLTPYYQQYGWDARFGDSVLANITQYGGYHGVPWTIQGEALFYNKTLFDTAGITKVPTTYAELVDAADKLKAAGITPFATGGTVNWYVMRLLDSLIETTCGAGLADQINTLKASWAGQTCVNDSFTELKKWADNYFNDGYMSIDDTQSNELFYTGEAAMALQGSWFDSDVKDNGMDLGAVGVFTFPTGTGRLYGFGEGYYVSATTDKADLAAKWLDFITSTDKQKQTAGMFGALSVNQAVQPDATNPLNQLWPAIFSNATGMYLNNDQNLTLANTTEYWRIQNAVLTGEIAPNDAGAQFQKFIDANG
ncbi:MAG: extracellular solute-binding protein [Propionibacteriaceae bacterium]|jgi:raffinose/stachyose/melibiose transport system substrate-binding protein|nr:extracellular solute-binding protein [Propionibacteriaceae bacterium]